MPIADKIRFGLLWAWVKFRAFLRGLWSFQTLQLLVRVSMISACAPLIASGRINGSDVETAIGIVMGAIGLAWQAAVEDAKARKVPEQAADRIAELERENAELRLRGIGTVPKGSE